MTLSDRELYLHELLYAAQEHLRLAKTKRETSLFKRRIRELEYIIERENDR